MRCCVVGFAWLRCTRSGVWPFAAARARACLPSAARSACSSICSPCLCLQHAHCLPASRVGHTCLACLCMAQDGPPWLRPRPRHGAACGGCCRRRCCVCDSFSPQEIGAPATACFPARPACLMRQEARRVRLAAASLDAQVGHTARCGERAAVRPPAQSSTSSRAAFMRCQGLCCSALLWPHAHHTAHTRSRAQRLRCQQTPPQVSRAPAAAAAACACMHASE